MEADNMLDFEGSFVVLANQLTSQSSQQQGLSHLHI